VRLTFTFSADWNDSMTLDTGALQGQPLYLPVGKIPDNQFTNWGSLFFNAKTGVVVGATLRGAEMARMARRGHSRFTGITTLQLTTTTGSPDFELTLLGYQPADRRFWWAEWYQSRAAELPPNLFPIFATSEPGWAPGERQTFWYLPSTSESGRRLELVVIDDIRQKLAARIPFTVRLPVTTVPVAVGQWRSGLYRLITVPAGAAVDPAVNDLDQKLTTVIVRPASPTGRILYVAPTDMWLAYSTNGGHDYHGWRTAYDGSVGYSPTVMSSRQHRFNHFFYSLYERFRDIHHLRYLDQLEASAGVATDYVTQHDVALGRVRLADYDLVQIGNHCEFTTLESYRRFQEYLAGGGNLMIHGGDSFAVLVEYLPSLDNPRYIWQRGHIWAHLGDQPSSFQPPLFLPPEAPPAAPILLGTAGSAADYLNLFHTTVGYWIPGSKAVVSNLPHPIMQGLGLRLGEEVPGAWAAEVDIAYEPQAWDILVRSDKAAPEEREFGIDAWDPTPFHRIGMAMHRNLGLLMVCGENYPNMLADSHSVLFRELYRRGIRYLLERGAALRARPRRPAPLRDDGRTIEFPGAVEIHAVDYELPEWIDYTQAGWHRQGAPYAHYRVEASLDGVSWVTLADRSHGPWRGKQTDVFTPTRVRYLRFDGVFSNGEPFRIANAGVR
jgi:hypothetical protein